MKKLFFVFILFSMLANAMDEAHRQQILKEHKHIAVLEGFEKEEFIKSKKSPEQIQEILIDLQELRATAGYTKFMNRGLLALAKKSAFHGNLEKEMAIARALVSAGALIPYSQTVAVSCNKPSSMGHPTIIKTESTLAIACGDLKDFLDNEWQKSCADVEWAEDTDPRGYSLVQEDH